MEISNKRVEELIPYAKNPRKNDEAVKYVAQSIEEFGFKIPIIIDKDNIIVAGHTRLKAAKQLGMTEVPCIIADDLTEEQVQAFRLADNKVAEIAEWDESLLKIELEDIVNINMEDFGFDLSEDEEEDTTYTTVINIPQYEITGECPTIEECCDTEKTDELMKEIEKADISEDDKKFLKNAAQRHLRFNYKMIAEYYAHASEEVQRLMEKSALVIIDYENAVANGYSSLMTVIDKERKGELSNE